MKKMILLAIAAAGLSFTMLKDDFTVTGSIAGAEGKKVWLEQVDAQRKTLKLDSAVVKDGKFTLKGTASEPSLHFLELEGVKGQVAFILEKGNITFTLYKDSIGKSVIGGTSNNVDLHRFNSTAMKLQQKMMDFQQKNTQAFKDAQSTGDTATVNKLVKELQVYQGEMTAMSAEFPAKHPKSFISLLFLDNMFNNPNVDIAKIRSDYDNLDASLKNTKPGKALKTRIDGFKPIVVGGEAPDFSAKSPEGKVISLKESLGKVTIIDFWASWCGPCRRENPNVVQLYKDYHAKGLNIIGVSLDRPGQEAAWKGAIEKDGLTWTQVSNLQHWDDPIAKMYHVTGIPATFLLDEKGKIVATNLRGEELRAKVASLLDQ